MSQLPSAPRSPQGAKKSISRRLGRFPKMTQESDRKQAATEITKLVEYLYDTLKKEIEKRERLSKKLAKIAKFAGS